MGFWDSDSSALLPNHIHGQLTKVPIFLLVSLFVFIFYSPSQLPSLLAVPVIFTHLFDYYMQSPAFLVCMAGDDRQI